MSRTPGATVSSPIHPVGSGIRHGDVKLIQAALKRWKRIKGFSQLDLVVNNVLFRDGVQVNDQAGCPA